MGDFNLYRSTIDFLSESYESIKAKIMSFTRSRAEEDRNRTVEVRENEIETDGNFDSEQAIHKAATDKAYGGECAKGTANVLLDQGYDVRRGHARDWAHRLDTDPRWLKLEGVEPENAPEGAVLSYSSDTQRGRRPRNGGGGVYGHVEIVGVDENGDRLYISDTPRDWAGGTVRNNFNGVYVYDPDGTLEAELYLEREVAQGNISLESVSPGNGDSLDSTPRTNPTFNDASGASVVAGVQPENPAPPPMDTALEGDPARDADKQKTVNLSLTS